MTEQEAIERIAEAIKQFDSNGVLHTSELSGIAQAAWNEIKAIARDESGKPPCPNPMTLEDARTAILRASNPNVFSMDNILA